jgi:hypothetical protein
MVIDALAVARLTRLVTSDRITRPFRRRAIAATYPNHTVPDGWEEFGPSVVLDDPDSPEAAYLLSCSWCSSIWCAGFVVAARCLVPGVWDPIARILAGSQVAGMAAAI